MLTTFGWKAMIGIVISNAIVYLIFKKELGSLEKKFILSEIKLNLKEKHIHSEYLKNDFKMAEERISRELQEEICRIKLAAKESTLVASTNLNEKDFELLEETFDQEFENLKMQQMSVSVPGLLPRDKRPKLSDPNWDNRCGDVPGWIIAVHVTFMIWTIVNAHYPAIFVSGLFFFVGFSHVT